MRTTTLLIIIICVTLTAVATLFAQEPQIIWNETFGGQGDDWGGGSIVEVQDEGYVTASMLLTGNNYNIWLFKVDDEGELVEDWGDSFGGQSTELYPRIISTEDGGYATLAVTYSYGAGLDDLWLIKTDSDGQQDWQIHTVLTEAMHVRTIILHSSS
ncbi:MAG: hypothetical protein HQ568_06065 [Calditrichaeota bacterium]|nr:hypothetical protein [Calditrichota bacterium]